MQLAESKSRSSSTWPSRRVRYASRGQALILAVLIMFVLAGLGGVFIAMINDAMVQTGKAVDRARLESIAQAGLRFAENQLRYSPDGADWRPGAGVDVSNPGWTAYGDGFYKVTLSYGPTSEISDAQPFLANPLERFLKIDVEARFALSNPPDTRLRDEDAATYDLYKKGFLTSRRFLTRRVTAYMPIGLPDYLLWITNIDGRQEPVNIGTGWGFEDLQTVNADPLTLSDNALASNSAIVSVPYLSIYDGPVRSEADVVLGNVNIINTREATVDAVRRHDLMEVVGQVTKSAEASATAIKLYDYDATRKSNTTPVAVRSLDPVIDQTSRVKDILQNLQTRDNNPLIRALKAPLLNQRDPVSGTQRYRALTRDTGIWANESASATAVSFYHTGLLGWGEGVYINNAEHIQYNGDLVKLRQEWLSTTAENWMSGVYQPNNWAVEVILHDYAYGSATNVVTRLPYIELRRTDGKHFKNVRNEDVGDRMVLPYPRNGVLYAEGNLIVKGNLPASLAFQDDDRDGNFTPLENGANVQQPGGWDHAGKNIRYFVDPANRRYDLTIVSGGTIYLEGNLLSPASRRNTYRDGGTQTRIMPGSPYDSKLALLAMDNVCFNPTRLFTVEKEPENLVLTADRFWRARAGDPISLSFTTAGPVSDRTRILLRHAGQSQLINPLYCGMRMWVNGTPFTWDAFAAEPTKYYFCNNDVRATFGLTPQQYSPAFFHPDWTMQYTRTSAMNTVLHGYGADNTVRFDWLEGTTDYLLSAGSDTLGAGFVVTPSEVQVDGLIYAQRGSWFIIPGRYYNEDYLNSDKYYWPYPKPGEPLDVRIVLNGAIVQNRPAPEEAEEAWQRHWAGSPLSYFSTGAAGSGVPDLWDPTRAQWNPTEWRWDDRRMGIEYHYDATLARPVCYDVDPDDPSIRYYRPRLPKLPVSPTIVSFTVLRGI